MSKAYYFPEEIVSQILSSIPVTSLIRFRSVCKSWRSVISDPQFIQTHLAISQKNPSFVIVAFSWELYRRCPGSFMYFHSLNRVLHLPQNSIHMCYFLSCNGLLCIGNPDVDVIYISNPSTKQFKRLPMPNKQFNKHLNVCLGFGFDSDSNDYKVLRFVYEITFGNLVDIVDIREVDLYSVNTDSWREILIGDSIRNLPCNCPSRALTCGPVLDGLLYLNVGDELAFFDLHNEMFGLITLPSSMQHERKSNVLDFEGSVALILNSVDDRSVHKGISLWMLDDVPGKMSWTKKVRFDTGLELDWVSLYLGAGRLVGMKGSVKQNVFYDYKKKKIIYIRLPSQDCVSDVFKYTQSLASIKGFEQVE